MAKKETTYIEPSTKSVGVSSAPSVTTRLSEVENLTKAILFVVAVTLVGVLVALITLIVDQQHFDDEMYKQQSGTFQQQLDQLKTQLNSKK